MMAEAKHTKTFYNTEIPSDWEVKKLGKLGNVVSGLTYSPDDICEETGVLVLRSSNVQSGRITFANGDFSLFTLHSSFKIDKYSYVATPEEIQENDYNLNIPRYVDTFEEEAEVDIAAVQKEIEQLEGELVKVQSEIEVYLKQLIN